MFPPHLAPGNYHLSWACKQPKLMGLGDAGFGGPMDHGGWASLHCGGLPWPPPARRRR